MQKILITLAYEKLAGIDFYSAAPNASTADEGYWFYVVSAVYAVVTISLVLKAALDFYQHTPNRQTLAKKI